MAIPPRLADEIAELRKSFELEVLEDSTCVNLIFEGFDIGEGYNVRRTRLLIRMPLSYPDAGPDMFWTDPSLLLSNGSVPQAANSMEVYANRQWRRFSWHHNRWNALTDNIGSYLAFVRERFARRA